MISAATLHLTVLIANILSLLFLAGGIFYLAKQIRFEEKKIHSPLNLIILSLTLIGINVLINSLSRLSHYISIDKWLNYIKLPINDLLYINNLVIIPLAAIFMFIAMLFLNSNE